MEYLPLFILLALLAEILGTVGGFGSSLFFVPIASYFLDFHSVLGITAIFHVSSNITKIAFFRKGFDKKVVLSLGIPAVLFVIIGAFMSKYIASEILETALAIFLIVTSLTFLIFKQLEVKPTLTNSIGGGVLSGLIAGVLGTGGAIRGITLAAFNMKTEVFIATSAIIDLGIDASRSVVYTLNGYVHTHDLYLIPILLVVSILGTWIGKKILDRVSQEQFKSTVLILILLTGIITLGKVIFDFT
ncbi:MAG: sulfite exporter TauE/SafE family protein [Flavobacteriales bacterium]|nr:sulfite exporter TauE/SafE family protein [Flavobacteriales bacterium]MCB9203800.1 sulfite exporter TauE/SafE family protein [Flavobacteriales bacterium]